MCFHNCILAASLSGESRFSTATLLLRRVFSGQSEKSGRFGGGALKRQELKQSVSDGGGIRSCRTGSSEKSDVFLNVRSCEHVLVVTKN